MEVEIISKECIKPSSPTPHHLRIHKLSLLDQFMPSFLVPMVLYYPIDNHSTPIQKHTIEEDIRQQLLKKSLSQTLVRFYPFAGRVKDNLSIDCNDEGVYYVEARVKSNLSEFLSQPDLSLIHHFLPCDFNWNGATAGATAAMVQVSVFDCGGITIGVLISHMVADGLALAAFLKDWGATTRGCCDSAVVTPDFSIARTLFPQNDSFPTELSLMGMLYPILKAGKAVTRRFVFDASALNKLKAKSTSSWVQNPTRVEAISALIWKCTMAAYKLKSGIQKPFLLNHAVNLRHRKVPPLSEYVMGNLIGLAFAQYTTETETETETDTDVELGNLVHELRKAIAKINGEFVRKLEGDQGFHNLCKSHKEISGALSSAALSNEGADQHLLCTSWCHFGFYEVDFGWGTPMWATCTGPPEEETSAVLNYVCMMENKSGDSIEAWVSLEEQYMAILECDKQLLTFASLNPSPSPLQAGNLASRT